ncbi:MAG TPA: cellulase family glycosylhydrolase [Solirubrobacteraceae bacterium]|nr:cellulase family glycosylhydrolase [Solirubrobacteraceae bacterium]
MLRKPHTYSASALFRPVFALACVLLTLASLDAVAAQAGPAYRGAQVHSLWSTVSNTEMTEELNALQGADVNVLRVDVGWATLETAKGHYDPTYLAKLDALSAGAGARGIKIIATLWQTPSWASTGRAWNDPPSNPAYYGAFAKFITGRYGPELAAVEAWNEPEINENLNAPNVAAAYAPMVKAFYEGAKEGNAAVPVLAGSLAYADLPFLKELYADGIRGFYDGISVHPYADGAAPANTAVRHSFLGGIESLHAAQLAAGDDTPEWITEFGWPTGASAGANTEQQQAEYTGQAFGLLDGLPYVAGATVYELRDMATNPADPEDNFGMLRQNFQPTPAYAALKAAMQLPSASEPFRPGAPETGSGSSEGGSGAGAGSGEGGSGAGGQSGSPSPPSPPEASTPPSPTPGSTSPEAGSSGSGSSATGSGVSSSGSGSSGSGHGNSTSGGGHHVHGGRSHRTARLASAGSRSRHRGTDRQERPR